MMHTNEKNSSVPSNRKSGTLGQEVAEGLSKIQAFRSELGFMPYSYPLIIWRQIILKNNTITNDKIKVKLYLNCTALQSAIIHSLIQSLTHHNHTGNVGKVSCPRTQLPIQSSHSVPTKHCHSTIDLLKSHNNNSCGRHFWYCLYFM